MSVHTLLINHHKNPYYLDTIALLLITHEPTPNRKLLHTFNSMDKKERSLSQ